MCVCVSCTVCLTCVLRVCLQSVSICIYTVTECVSSECVSSERVSSECVHLRPRVTNVSICVYMCLYVSICVLKVCL